MKIHGLVYVTVKGTLIKKNNFVFCFFQTKIVLKRLFGAYTEKNTQQINKNVKMIFKYKKII